MANKHVRRCSTALVIKKMQIKTMVRYYFISIKMTIIKKIENEKCWTDCGKIRILMHCWPECKMQLLWKTVWQFLKKVNIALPYNLAILLLGLQPKELKAGTQTDTFSAHSSIVHNSQKVDTTHVHQQMNEYSLADFIC